MNSELIQYYRYVESKVPSAYLTQVLSLKSFANSEIPAPFLEVIAIRLMYIFLKCRRWIKDATFDKVTQNVLENTFKLRADHARSFLNDFHDEFSKLYTAPTSESLSFHLAVLSYFPGSIIDLGLSEDLETRVQQCKDIYGKMVHENWNYFPASTFEERLLLGFSEIDEYLGNNTMDLAFLRLSQQFPTECRPSNTEIICMLELLELAGSHNELTVRLAQQLQKQKTNSRGDFTIQKLLTLMDEYGVVTTYNQGLRKNLKSWRLTKLGVTIVASMITDQLHQNPNDCITRIMALTPNLQAKIIPELSLIARPIVEQILQKMDNYPPPVIAACASWVTRNNQDDLLASTFSELVRRKVSNWKLAAICESLLREHDSPEITQAIIELAERSGSELLKSRVIDLSLSG